MNSLLFSSKGRINRLTYLASYFGVLIATFLVGRVLFNVSSLVLPACAIFLFIVNLNLTIKRFHDIGKSAWWVLLFCLPIVNILTWVYLLLSKGQEGDNLYGPPSTIFVSKKDIYNKPSDEASSKSDLQSLLDKKFNE